MMELIQKIVGIKNEFKTFNPLRDYFKIDTIRTIKEV